MSRAEAFIERWKEARGTFGIADALRYMTAAYWPRVRERFAWLPQGTIALCVDVRGAPVHALVRCNGADLTVFRGIFMEREYAVEGRLRSTPRTILDVGANCGYAALFFGACYPEAAIAVVEPVPRNVAALRTNLKLNGLAPVIIEAAMATSDGEAELFLTGNDSCESLSPIHPWSSRMKVETKSVDSVLELLGWSTIDLLKLDIEGYERVLLARSPDWLDKVQAVVAELHGGYTLEEFGRDLGEDRFVVEVLSEGYEKTFLATRRVPLATVDAPTS